MGGKKNFGKYGKSGNLNLTMKWELGNGKHERERGKKKLVVCLHMREQFFFSPFLVPAHLMLMSTQFCFFTNCARPGYFKRERDRETQTQTHTHTDYINAKYTFLDTFTLLCTSTLTPKHTHCYMLLHKVAHFL